MDNCEKHGILNRGRTLKSAAVGALAFALCALGAEAKNIYITPDADGTGDGSSWASPMSLAYKEGEKRGNLQEKRGNSDTFGLRGRVEWLEKLLRQFWPTPRPHGMWPRSSGRDDAVCDIPPTPLSRN